MPDITDIRVGDIYIGLTSQEVKCVKTIKDEISLYINLRLSHFPNEEYMYNRNRYAADYHRKLPEWEEL